MNESPINFRDHIRPLVIADTIFTAGLLLLILLWMFGEDQDFLSGFFYNKRSLALGLGIGLSIAGGILLLNAIRGLIRARRA